MDDLTGQVAIIHAPTGWAGRIVQIITRSHWNHTVTMISNTRCVSAEPGGVRTRNISHYTDNEEVVWSQLELTPAQRHTIRRWSLDHLGDRYNWLAYIAIGIALTTGRATPRWLRRWLDNSDDLICSQACDMALQAANIHLFKDHRVAGAVHPGSFGAYFHEHGWTDKA